MAAGLLTAITSHAPVDAALYALVIAPFSLLSPLPILFLGMKYGLSMAFRASLIAFVVAAIAEVSLGSQFNLVDLVAQLAMVLTIIRYGLLSRQTDKGEEWYPAGYILAYLSVIAVIQTIFYAGYYGDRFFEVGDEQIQQILSQMQAKQDVKLKVAGLIRKIYYIAPAIQAIWTLILVVINTGLLQKVLERRQENIRPTGAFSQLQLPVLYLLIFAGFAGITLLGFIPYYAPNVMIVITLPFFFVGLSLVHEWVRQKKIGAFALVIFYIVMVVFWWLIAAVVLLGIVEPWLRSHLKASSKLKG